MLKGNLKLNIKDKSRKQKEERKWDAFITAIMEGRVIPVIGPDFLTEAANDSMGNPEFVNHHQQLIDVLASACDIEEELKTFSQLIHNRLFRNAIDENREAIYSLLTEVLDQLIEQKHLRPNHLLVKLLKTRLFPFVITTSFSPVVELIMKEAWPECDVRVLQFRNDSKRDLMLGVGDISDEKDLAVPTVYYMFGKYSNEPNRYVVSDLDMMDFCKSWLSGGSKVPRVLFEALKKRYLLVLGNNYSDWLFRFIWYAIRNTPDMMRSSMILNESIEPSLLRFLEQVQTFIERNPSYVIDEIERRVGERRQVSKEFMNKEENEAVDVFLSYSRRDVEITMKIADALRKRGLKVWYDIEAIPEGENWRTHIKRGISGSKLFIPVLTANIEQEYAEPHEYREEWRLAAELARKMGGRKFIWPLVEKGFDFYSFETDVPIEFSEKNASWFDSNVSFDDFAEKIKSEIDIFNKRNQELKK